ncbi:MAG: M48 family metalloprotease [Candidatus Dadabacteria bacterium]|nr:M48 family metalloprotease [Candidatus Dadabacteria bacterium]NIQ15849.1 M48 family metalloprotease [Candidatus Dadabacteria bacterium]
MLFISLVVLFTSILIACYKAPVTGRNQLILISEAQEREMGLVAFQEIIKKEKLTKNKKYQDYVERVGKRIAKVSHTPNLDWEYKVIENDKTINAFALPGGKVGVYTGILKVAETEAGLATVMAHEVAHATARHGGERVSAGILAQIGAVGIAVAMRKKDPKVVNSVLQAYGIGTAVGVILPFGRSQESEADRIGLIYMAKAGYNPKEAIKFWQRMEKKSKGKAAPPEFLSTHPNYGTRIKNLNKWMPEAMEYYKKAPKAPNDRIL